MFLRKIFFALILSLAVVSVLGYGFYKALPIILGPKIELSTPQNGQTIEGTSAPIRGTVYRGQKLFINGIATPFSGSGFFESRLAVYPGNNILELTVQDKFGRKKSYTLNLGTK